MTFGYARCSTNESKQDINRQVRELKAVLSPEGTKAWEEYMDAISALHDLAECDRFMEGFRMGAKFMLDIFQPEIHFAHHDS